jgi:hypothetical protein
MTHGSVESMEQSLKKGDYLRAGSEALLRVRERLSGDHLELVNAVTGERTIRTRAQALNWMRTPSADSGREAAVTLAQLICGACRGCGALTIEGRREHRSKCSRAFQELWQPVYFNLDDDSPGGP